MQFNAWVSMLNMCAYDQILDQTFYSLWL